MKKIKKMKEAHTADTKYGMGDYYGTGLRNPMGRMRDEIGIKKASVKKTKAPKTLA